MGFPFIWYQTPYDDKFVERAPGLFTSVGHEKKGPKFQFLCSTLYHPAGMGAISRIQSIFFSRNLWYTEHPSLSLTFENSIYALLSFG